MQYVSHYATYNPYYSFCLHLMTTKKISKHIHNFSHIFPTFGTIEQKKSYSQHRMKKELKHRTSSNELSCNKGSGLKQARDSVVRSECVRLPQLPLSPLCRDHIINSRIPSRETENRTYPFPYYSHSAKATTIS